MEYQQFLNFLKKQECYDKFEEFVVLTPHIKGLIKFRVKYFSEAVIVECLHYSLLYNYNDIISVEKWARLNHIWKENYTK
jgi:hypothetical protein